MGMLGALEGLGQGMQQVGTDWANEAKEKRIMALKERMTMDSEERTSKSRMAQAEQEHRWAMERDKEKEGASLRELREKKRLGMGMAGDEGPSKQARVKLDAAKQYADERELWDEDVQGPLPSLSDWAAKRGLGELFPKDATPTTVAEDIAPDMVDKKDEKGTLSKIWDSLFGGEGEPAKEPAAGVSTGRGIGAASRPAPAASEGPPYKDGKELVGPGGKIYVVRGGVPVPK